LLKRSRVLDKSDYPFPFANSVEARDFEWISNLRQLIP